MGGLEHTEEALPEVAGVLDEHFHCRGQGEDGGSEDNGHNTGHIHFQRNVGALSAVHLAADHSLCVLDRQAALRIVHPNDVGNHQQHQYARQGSQHIESAASGDVADLGIGAVQGGKERRDTGDDTCEEDHGNAVADTLFVDALTQPHDQSRTADERGNDDQSLEERPETGISHTVCGLHQVALILQVDVVGGTLNQAQDNRYITCDGSNLLSAFFALFGQSFQSGDCYGEQLHDNRTVDVRGDGHGENRTIVKRITGHHLQVLHESTCAFRSEDACLADVQKRNRDCSTDTENQENEECEENLFAQLGNAPRIDDDLKQIRSPLPFHRRLQFSVSRSRKRHLL